MVTMRLLLSLALLALRLAPVVAGTEKTEAPTVLYVRPGEAAATAAATLPPPTFCQTARDCREAAAALGHAPFRAGPHFPTKGCYAKNGKAFFSPGDEGAMTSAELPGAQERIYCPAAPAVPAPAVASPTSPPPTSPPTPSPTDAATAPPPAPAAAPVPCTDEAACRAATAALGLSPFYASPRFATKGCYRKNGKAFFSPGTADEMATTELRGTQARVYCPGD